jgi:hypothetical protein
MHKCGHQLGTGGAADLNGYDSVASNTGRPIASTATEQIIDIFGALSKKVTAHEFKDGCAQRHCDEDVPATSTLSASGTVDSDGGGGAGPQTGPADVTPKAWSCAAPHHQRA